MAEQGTWLHIIPFAQTPLVQVAVSFTTNCFLLFFPSPLFPASIFSSSFFRLALHVQHCCHGLQLALVSAHFAVGRALTALEAIPCSVATLFRLGPVCASCAVHGERLSLERGFLLLFPSLLRRLILSFPLPHLLTPAHRHTCTHARRCFELHTNKRQSKAPQTALSV